ncbi:MAG: ATP-dependent DNA helicase [Candidatus Woesearchaeota archaeon]
MQEIYFPHNAFRPIQDKLVERVIYAVEHKKNLIVHAPTGLGKTAATIAPALTYAIKNNKKVFFLTSRHTQHRIAVETLKLIRKRYDIDFSVVDIIGKKWMCPQPGTDTLYSNEFSEYCKAVREDGKCQFYLNTKNKQGKLTVKAQAELHEIKHFDLDKLIKYCTEEELCPYEMSLALAVRANIIITDYYYIFNPAIREMFFSKTGISLEDVILIVDEAHNLPFRVRDLMTQRLSNILVKRAIKEAKKYQYDDMVEHLLVIENSLRDISKSMMEKSEPETTPEKKLDFFSSKIESSIKIKENEKLVSKEEFMIKIKKYIENYEQLIADLEFVADEIREKQKISYLGSIASFLEFWQDESEGFTRILTVKPGNKDPITILSYRCLDPSIICKDVINNTHSSIIMSGTLIPVEMYRDLLGVELPESKIFESPFPKNNRLNLIIPETTTKYSMRSDDQFKRIGEACAKITNAVPGNSAIFFPSYFLRDRVYETFTSLSEKTTFQEIAGMNKQEKQEMLENFMKYKDMGAVLLGASSGSFGEGVDLPGDLLKCVVVVGLPLNQPDLETKQLIEYFDKKFGKGWDYGYIFPAFNKTLQNAGRCIRSENDKGIVVFLDERYAWPRYVSLFPNDLNLKITKKYEDEIKKFFVN